MGELASFIAGIFSISQANSAAKSANSAAMDQQKAQQDLLNQAKAKSDQEAADSKNNANRDAARNKQRAAAAASQGRNSTLLTGPLGSVGNQSGSGGKTLLGY